MFVRCRGQDVKMLLGLCVCSSCEHSRASQKAPDAGKGGNERGAKLCTMGKKKSCSRFYSKFLIILGFTLSFFKSNLD